MSTEYSDCFESSEWLSDCCGDVAYLGLSSTEDPKQKVGICSRCKEHAGFSRDEELVEE